jgi:rubrerythrin
MEIQDIHTIKAEEEEKNKDVKDIWICPNCNHRIPNILFMDFRCDFGCPYCRTSFSKFILHINYY